MSRLMILGGSNCQKNALIAAKKRGHETILADYYEHPPAAAWADFHVRASTFDVPACLAAAKEYGADGIFTIGTDQPVLTAARVAQACGLPNPISPETALAVTNKKVMKRILREHGIPTVEYRLIGRESAPGVLNGMRPPFVLKPLDSQGQRGIFKLESEAAVLAHLEQSLAFSREGEALAEAFYPSDEITVSGWVQNGTLHVLAVTDRQLYDDPKHIGVCVGHRFPSIHMGRYPEIRAICERIVPAFGIENGPLYVQLLCGEHGIVVNELACRIGGAFEDVFIPWLSGFDLLGAVLSAALGEPVDCGMLADFDPSRSQKQISVQLMFCERGEAAFITPLEKIRAMPHVLDAGYNFCQGDQLPALENATARFGHCVMVTENGDMDALVRAFYKQFEVLDMHGHNQVIPRDFRGRIAERI